MRDHPAPGIQRVLVDTGAYFALAVPHDANHSSALRILEALDRRPSRLFTTNFIVAEIHALLLTRRGRDLAARVLAQIDRSSTTIVRVSNRDEQRAREIIHRHTDKEFSLTDATSFSVMERLRISVAFTFDRNFVQYGLAVLRP